MYAVDLAFGRPRLEDILLSCSVLSFCCGVCKQDWCSRFVQAEEESIGNEYITEGDLHEDTHAYLSPRTLA
jgi:hypothetical protein